ncbi:MAG: radical SAM family heme chaperone HemW [Geminicoccaceae bacterium]
MGADSPAARLEFAGDRETIATGSAGSQASGIYVHWPFCKAKCPYCDFNSHVRAGVDQERWAGALVRELGYGARRGFAGPVHSVFFGGGTPSLMEPATVEAVLRAIRDLWHVADDAEITLEANPTSVEASKLAGFAAAGVNRVSLGVQSLDDAALRFLGREHTACEAMAAVELANRTFDRVSLDLIYARAGQTVEGWMEELDAALALGTRHLSLYQLTIEPGTRFHALFGRGALPVMEDGVQADLFQATRDSLRSRGFRAYEISNFCRPGEESRHNLVYWRYGDYLGVGPGAHGRLSLDGTKMATRNLRQPDSWLEAVEHHGHGEYECERLDGRTCALEALMMGLRLEEGVPLDRLERLSGSPWRSLFDRTGLDRALAAGLVGIDAGREASAVLRASDAGILVLDDLLATIAV